MTKEQRKIKVLIAQVEDLTKRLEEVKSDKEKWYSRYCEANKQLGELHDTFDLLRVPRKDRQQEYASDLSLSSRMTLYVAGIRDNTEDKGN